MKESKDPMEILNEIRNRVIQGEDPLNILNVNNQENTIEEQDEADEIMQLNAEKKHLEESIRLKEQESGELQAANEELNFIVKLKEETIEEKENQINKLLKVLELYHGCKKTSLIVKDLNTACDITVEMLLNGKIDDDKAVNDLKEYVKFVEEERKEQEIANKTRTIIEPEKYNSEDRDGI